MATTAIGLDIGTTHVRALELQQGRGAPTLLRYAEVALPPGAVREGEVADAAAVTFALRQLWTSGGFSHRKVVMGVGNQRVLVRDLELPWMPMDQIRASLPFQVRESLPIAVEDALMDYYPTLEFEGPNGRTLNGLLVAATRDTVRANVQAAEGANLAPQLIDHNGLALTRTYIPGGFPAPITAIVDIGARVTTVVIVEDGMPQMIRVLPAGGQDGTDALASVMSLTAPEAEAIKRQIGVGFGVSSDLAAGAEALNQVTQSLVESVRNTLAYYASAHPGRGAQHVVLSGGGAYLAGLGQYLSTATRVPATIADLLSSLTVRKQSGVEVVAGAESTIAVALGLALGGQQ